MCFLKKCLLLGVSVLLVLSTAEAKSVASRFSVCKTKEKNFQECFRESVEKALRGPLAEGIPDLGFVPLDPLTVPRMAISTGDGPVGLTLKLENSSHSGLSGAKIISSNADPKNHKFDLKLKIPHYSAIGPYEASGRILLLPIVGKGISNFTYYDLDVHWIIEGKPKTDAKGKTYLELEKFDVKTSSDKAFISMTGLFDGDKTLSETMLKFLNEHQREFIKEIEPALNEAFSQLYLGLSKPLFRKLPYEEMFPDL